VSKKRRQQSRTTPKRRKRSARSSTSLIIPIVVGLVVLTLIVGSIILVESRQSATVAMAGNSLAGSNTARALPTGSIPFPDVPRIALQEAKDKLESGQAMLVDVRSKQSYDRSHATGAISLPETEIDARMDELPADKELVLY
jgi:hypothetical protein